MATSDSDSGKTSGAETSGSGSGSASGQTTETTTSPGGVGPLRGDGHCGDGCFHVIKHARLVFGLLAFVQFCIYVVRLGLIADKRQESFERALQNQGRPQYDAGTNGATQYLLLFSELGVVFGLAMVFVSVMHLHRWHQYTRWASIGTVVTSVAVDMLALGFSARSIYLGSETRGVKADSSWKALAALTIVSNGLRILYQALLHWPALTANYKAPEVFDVLVSCPGVASWNRAKILASVALSGAVYAARLGIAASLVNDSIKGSLTKVNGVTEVFNQTTLLSASVGGVFVAACVWHAWRWAALSKIQSSALGFVAFALDLWCFGYAIKSWAEGPLAGNSVDKRLVANQALVVVQVVLQALTLLKIQLLVRDQRESETPSLHSGPSWSRLAVLLVTVLAFALHAARAGVVADIFQDITDSSIRSGFNAASGWLVVLALLSSVVGMASAALGLVHAYKWSFASSATVFVSALLSLAWSVLSGGFACKQISVGGSLADRFVVTAALSIVAMAVDLAAAAVTLVCTRGQDFSDEATVYYNKGGPVAFPGAETDSCGLDDDGSGAASSSGSEAS